MADRDKTAANDRQAHERELALSGFQHALNLSGYPFQYAVLRELETMYKQRRSSFVPVVAEYPVALGSNTTRVDFILRHERRSFFLVCECKRVNPAYASWCFIQAPFVRAGRTHEPAFVEVVKRQRREVAGAVSSSETVAGLQLANWPIDAATIGMEVRTDRPGDERGHRAGAIEEAATQVLRGLNGFVEDVSNREPFISSEGVALLLPVIFTTATLYYSSADPSQATLSSGEIDLRRDKFEARPWVAVQYPQSPTLKPRLPNFAPSSDPGEVLDKEFIRTIAIVNALTLPQFLAWAENFP